MSDYGRRFVYKAGITPSGAQDTLNLDTFTREFFQASFHVDLVSGSMSVQPEYTMDDLDEPLVDPASVRWFPYGDVLTQTTLVSIDTPISGVRLNIGSFTGEIRLAVLQGIPQ